MFVKYLLPNIMKAQKVKIQLKFTNAMCFISYKKVRVEKEKRSHPLERMVEILHVKWKQQ